MRLLFIVLGLSSLLVGCATIHPGKRAKILNGNSSIKLQVSGRLVHEYSDEYHQFVEVTFNNIDSNWIKIERIEVAYGDGSVPHNIPTGKELADWSVAMHNKIRMENYNQSLAFGTLIGVGGVMMASNSSSSRGAGQVVAGAGLIGVSGMEVRDAYKKGQRVSVPNNHLYTPFSIPAGLFQRKWILIHVPGDDVFRSIFLTIYLKNGQSEKYLVPFSS